VRLETTAVDLVLEAPQQSFRTLSRERRARGHRGRSPRRATSHPGRQVARFACAAAAVLRDGLADGANLVLEGRIGSRRKGRGDLALDRVGLSVLRDKASVLVSLAPSATEARSDAIGVSVTCARAWVRLPCRERRARELVESGRSGRQWVCAT